MPTIRPSRVAVGSLDSVTSRYPSYEVHFSCRTHEDVLRAQQLMSRIPGARLADDVATRFEVPVAVQPDVAVVAAATGHVPDESSDAGVTVIDASVDAQGEAGTKSTRSLAGLCHSKAASTIVISAADSKAKVVVCTTRPARP